MSTDPRAIGAIRRIVLCADDFGLTEAGCESTLELLASGAISATSCVVDGESIRRHATALRGVTSSSALGLHFNLTQSDATALSASLPTWLLRSHLRRIDAQALRNELRRQLNLFETLLKQPPAHVDGHEHVHQFPGIADILVDELSRRYGVSVAVRSTTTLRGRGIKARIIASLGGPRLRRLLLARRLMTNRDFAGVYDFSTRIPYGERMRRWVESIADGGMIMCHPQRAASGDPARDAEHAFLSSPDWTAMRTQHRVQLVPFVPHSWS